TSEKSNNHALISHPIEEINDDGAIVGGPKNASISGIVLLLGGEERIDDVAMGQRARGLGLAALLETRLDITVAIDEIHRVIRTRASCDQRGDGRNLGTTEVYSIPAELVPICRDSLQELRT